MNSEYKVNITEPAELDLISAIDYIEFTLLNPKAADDLLALAYSKFKSLNHMPATHALVNDSVLAHLGVHQIIIDNYLAFFTISEEDKTVYILRFMYSARNWTEILKEQFTKD